MNNEVKKENNSKAKEFEVNSWIDSEGNSIEPIKLSDLKGKFKVLYCFQNWCPGCHSKGLPDLKKMAEALKEKDDVFFMAVQTVFEGFESNTYEKIAIVQKDYDLKIPFGHDAGSNNKSVSNIMRKYKTGGTPWFIFIDKEDHIVFSDFHLNADAAIQYLKAID